MRVDIIKRLKNELGSNFTGGLYNSKYAQENYPELILDESITQKENYLNLVKNCDICIGSLGLHKSTGWKTAEYVAASKAIVNENLFYESLGDFESGKNYLGFKDENECIEHIYELIKNPDKIVKMQNNNYIYYNKFLRPDMQVLNTLLMVMNN